MCRHDSRTSANNRYDINESFYALYTGVLILYALYTGVLILYLLYTGALILVVKGRHKYCMSSHERETVSEARSAHDI